MVRRRRADRSAWLLPLAACAWGTACARVHLPAPDVVARAGATPSYSGRLRVSLDGPELRARTGVLLGFRRPDALRIEIPGPAGARLIAVAAGGRLTAVFPSERAVFASAAGAEDLRALLGVALSPAEIMDALVGVGSPRLRAYSVRWGVALPRRIEATLPDGGRLRVTVETADAPAALPEAAFAEPPHAGHRSVNADEARRLWGGR